jgi:hypothetical protein
MRIALLNEGDNSFLQEAIMSKPKRSEHLGDARTTHAEETFREAHTQSAAPERRGPWDIAGCVSVGLASC